jgi:PAS domain-containing protein
MVFSAMNQSSEPFWRAIFDALPLPAFIVDEDMRILDFNVEAETMLGSAPKSCLRRRGGDVLHCLYAEQLGCGQTKLCKKCLIRNAVKTAMEGVETHRKHFQAQLRGSRGAMSVNLLVTARHLPATGPTPQALLILENVEETVRRHHRQPVL